MSTLWVAILVLAAVVLLVILMKRNRREETPADVARTEDIARTEAATHRLYEQEDAEDHARDDRVER